MRTRPRRTALGALLASVTLLTACASSQPGRPHQATPPVRNPGAPNFVFVLTDDLSLNLLPYMPNVAALERDGASFSNYYVVNSLCCPSRTAIFTGQYPHNNGVLTNSGPYGGYRAFNAHDDIKKSFAVALHRAGYRTGMMGKYLNGYQPQRRQPIGWDEWDVAGWGYPEFNYVLNQNGTLHAYGDEPGDYLTDVVSKKATQFIDDAAHRARPFALEVATFAPHLPATPAPRDKKLFDSLRAPRTPAFDRISIGAPHWLAGRPPLTSAAKRAFNRFFRRRVRSVQAVDEMIGRLRRELERTGAADNTYFVFSSDNGFHMGEHRLHVGKRTAFDTDIRVPLVIAGPGIAAGRTIPAMTSSIDLAPTFEQLAGLTPSPEADGISLEPLLHSESTPADWPTAALVEHLGLANGRGDPDRQSELPPTYEAIRTATELYVEYVDGDREYYDTATDPYEMDNLVDTASPARLATLSRALHRLASCVGAEECRAAALVRPPPP